MIEDPEFSSIRPLIDWLNYNGFTVITKPAKEFDDGEGRRKFKRSMSVELAVNAMELVEHVDQIVLFSGDGDFRSLVGAVQSIGRCLFFKIVLECWIFPVSGYRRRGERTLRLV